MKKRIFFFIALLSSSIGIYANDQASGVLSHKEIFEQALLSGLISANAHETYSLADNCYLKLEPKIETINEKIKNGRPLSDSERSYFKKLLGTPRHDPYFRYGNKTKSVIYKLGDTCQIKPIIALLDNEHIIAAINHPQLNNNSETIDAILEYTLNQKTEFSYECFRALLPFIDKHGADYIKRNGMIITIYGLNIKKPVACVDCIFCDRTLAQYIKRYGTTQENSEILASLIQDFKFRPRTIAALSEKLNDVQDVFANRKEKLLSHISDLPCNILHCDELISAFPELKNEIAEKAIGSRIDCFVPPAKRLIIDDRIENRVFFQEINERTPQVPTDPEELLDLLITSDYRWSYTTFGKETFARMKEEHPYLLRNKLMAHLRTTSGIWHVAFLDYLLTNHPEIQQELEALLQQKESSRCLWIEGSKTYDQNGVYDFTFLDATDYPEALKFGEKYALSKIIQ